MKVEKCRGKTCEASIVWMKTASKGKWMPFDSKPERRFMMERRGNDTVAVSVATYMPHHATCPDADSFRKKD